MYTLREPKSINQLDQTVKPLHNLGNHLIIEFMNTDVDLNDYDGLDAKLREILTHTTVIVEG
jgi:hypothetical protein